jgi:hypothetical protein
VAQWHHKNPKKPKPSNLVIRLSSLTPQTLTKLGALVTRATRITPR